MERLKIALFFFGLLTILFIYSKNAVSQTCDYPAYVWEDDQGIYHAVCPVSVNWNGACHIPCPEQ